MSERELSVAERVWRDAGIEPEPEKINLAPLTERADFRQPYIARHLGAFRRFLRCGLDAGGRLPDEVFLETLLANGRAAALALVDAFLARNRDEHERDEAQRARIESQIRALRTCLTVLENTLAELGEEEEFRRTRSRGRRSR